MSRFRLRSLEITPDLFMYCSVPPFKVLLYQRYNLKGTVAIPANIAAITFIFIIKQRMSQRITSILEIHRSPLESTLALPILLSWR
jgi:hypothetical protein